MKHVIFALGLATAALSLAGQAQAVVVAQHDYTPERTGAANAVTVQVTPGKKIGFVTCGGVNHGIAGSLGCTDYPGGHETTTPWSAYPGYRLSNLPASYRVTGIAFDSYNHIATVYFEY